MKIPQKKWIQLNEGDRSGNIFASWNMDIGDVIKPAPRCKYVLDDTDEANLELITAFTKTGAGGTNEIWALSNTGRLFKAGSSPASTSDWEQDGITGTPTNCDDMVDFRGDLIVANFNDLSKLDAASPSSWNNSFWKTTLSQSSLVGNLQLHVADFINTYLLLGEGNKLHVITSDDSVLGSGDGRIVLPTEYTIEWIRSSSNRYWIGTSHNTDGEAKIFEWNGKDPTPTNAYGVKSQRTFSATVLNDILYTVNDKGQLLGFNGSGFEEVARFPIANEVEFQNRINNVAMNVDKLSRLSNDAISHRGIETIEDKIHIFINTESSSGAQGGIEEMPSGVWVYDPKHGLHHKHGVGQTRRSPDTIYDYGSPVIRKAGAIFSLGGDENDFLYGAEIYENESEASGIYTIGTGGLIGNRRGFIITSRILSTSIKENFNKLWAIVERFRKDGEEIIIKYRTEKDPTYPIQGIGVNISITWTDTDTFTTIHSDYADVKAGDEVIILCGKGAGTTVHVDSISESGGTYTVNLDEAISNASGTALARVTNWKRIGSMTSTTRQSDSFGITKPKAEWIQFKLEFRSVSGSGNSPRLDKLELEFSTGQNA